MMLDFLWAAKEWALKHRWYIIIAIVAFTAGGVAFAGPVSEFKDDNGEKIVLFNDACESKSGNLAIFTDKEKIQHKGCWKLGPDHFVYILYEDGDMGRVAQTRFRAVKSL